MTAPSYKRKAIRVRLVVDQVALLSDGRERSVKAGSVGFVDAIEFEGRVFTATFPRGASLLFSPENLDAIEFLGGAAR